jgi:phosphatidylglycerol:prolipoprotein diacylglycerol transferase
MPAIATSDYATYLILHGGFIALGVWHGVYLVRMEARRCQMNATHILDLCFVVLIAAAVGSRLPFLIVNFLVFFDDPLEMVRIWRGGVEFYGGFLVAFLSGAVFVRYKKMPLWQTADIFAPAVAMGVFWGKLGYLALGYAQGQQLQRMALLSPAKFEWLNLFAVQVLLAILNLVMYFVLAAVKSRNRFPGQLFGLYVLMCAGSITLTTVMWKIGILNWRQMVMQPKLIIGGMLILISAAMLIVFKNRKSRATDAGSKRIGPVSRVPEKLDTNDSHPLQTQ